MARYGFSPQQITPLARTRNCKGKSNQNVFFIFPVRLYEWINEKKKIILSLSSAPALIFPPIVQSHLFHFIAFPKKSTRALLCFMCTQAGRACCSLHHPPDFPSSRAHWSILSIVGRPRAAMRAKKRDDYRHGMFTLNGWRKE